MLSGIKGASLAIQIRADTNLIVDPDHVGEQ